MASFSTSVRFVLLSRCWSAAEVRQASTAGYRLEGGAVSEESTQWHLVPAPCLWLQNAHTDSHWLFTAAATNALQDRNAVAEPALLT